MNKISVLLLLTVGIITGCATGRWVNDPIISDQYVKVGLEHRVGDDAVSNPQYRHPVQMDPAQVRQLLTGLTYQESAVLLGKPKIEPVFQDFELARLAPGISEALAKAGPRERVAFTSFNKGGGLLFAKRRITQGVIFMDPEDLLNIAFTCINCETRPDEPLNRSSDPLQRDPLEITKTERPLMLQHPFTTIHMDADGRLHPDWVVIDLDEFSASAARGPVNPVPASPPAAEEPGLKAPAPQVPQAPDAAVSAREAEPELQAAPDQTGSRWNSQKEKIKREFSLLKELYDEKLITSEEYEARKAKLLDQLAIDQAD